MAALCICDALRGLPRLAGWSPQNRLASAGFELGSGSEVHIPKGRMVIVGQTRRPCYYSTVLWRATMYRKLCAILLPLSAAFSFTFLRPASGINSLPTGPQIVTVVSFTNQTAAIPTTILFSPTRDGLYRISSYLTIPTGTGSGWYRYITWSDPASVQTSYFATPDNEMFIEAAAGKPVTYSTAPWGPQPPTYSVNFVVERLGP